MLEPLPVINIEPNFCPRDGTPLGDEMKAGVMRRVCPLCGYIYGRDPRVVVCLVGSRDGRLLFVERDKSWSLPLYSFAEHADPRVVAARLLAAETGLPVQPGAVIDTFSVYDESLGHILVLLYHARLEPGSQQPPVNVLFADPLARDAPSATALTRTVLSHLPPLHHPG